jgi:undecaprenyl phosphate-alpha-L-ara4N flippase subunit ArnE
MSAAPEAGAVALGLGRIVGLLGVAASLGCGQLLFKSAAEQLVVGQGLERLSRSFVSLPMLCALAMYGAATVAWVYLLRGMPLSRAYPFIAMAFALVPLMSHIVFGDKLDARYLLGLSLILVGMYLTATAGPA